MARKPIHLEMAGMLTPRERMWQAIRQKRTFTCMELQEACGRPMLNLYSIQDYLLALARAGYLKQLNKQGQDARAKFDQVRFELVKDSFEAPRLDKQGRQVEQGTATLAMWRAMKALKEFDYKDVQKAATLGKVCEVSLQTASDVHALGVEVVLQIAEANEATGQARVAALRVMHKYLDRLKLLLRFCNDERLVSAGQWAQAIKLMEAVGAQGGGWIKLTEKTSAA